MDYDDGVGSAVVSTGDGPEALLPGCIPDLELALVVVHLQCFELEVYSDGGGVVLVIHVIAEPEEDA